MFYRRRMRHEMVSGKGLPYDVHSRDCESSEKINRRYVMKINSFCLTCLIQMQESQIQKFNDEDKK